jgi:hypothetical protein
MGGQSALPGIQEFLMIARFASLISSTIFALLLSLPGAVVAEDKIDPGFREATKNFLIVQKTAEGISEQLVYSISQTALSSIAGSGISVTERMQEIVLEAARTVFGPRFSDIEYLTDLYTPLYVQHYSEKELRELVAFWKSPVGKKTIELMPKMTQGSYVILQKASAEYIPEFQKVLDERMAEAGVVLTLPTPPATAPAE